MHDSDEAEMTAPRPTWSAGIVNHGSFSDLDACLSSLERQSWAPEQIVVWDTGIDPEALGEVETRHADADFFRGTNEGYAGGANRVVAALTLETAPDYVLVLNPDVELDDDFGEKLVGAVQERPKTAIASGKLLRPGRKLFDTAGIIFPRHRRPRDRGSEEIDEGQYDQAELMDGVSGATMLIRVSMIEALELDGELFDETFFAYHEDTDLCWRARRFGFEIFYAPSAVAIHKRGWQKDRRRGVPVMVRRHSFKNHYLQVMKNESGGDLLRNLPWLLGWEVLRLGFVLLRDQAMLPAYVDAWRNVPSARTKRREIVARASARQGPG